MEARFDLRRCLKELVDLGYECYGNFRRDNVDEGVIISPEGDLVRLFKLKGNMHFESELQLSYTFGVLERLKNGKVEFIEICNPEHSTKRYKLDKVFSGEDVRSIIDMGNKKIEENKDYKKVDVDFFKKKYMKWGVECEEDVRMGNIFELFNA
jgi:hypothetical protein